MCATLVVAAFFFPVTGHEGENKYEKGAKYFYVHAKATPTKYPDKCSTHLGQKSISAMLLCLSLRRTSFMLPFLLLFLLCAVC